MGVGEDVQSGCSDKLLEDRELQELHSNHGVLRTLARHDRGSDGESSEDCSVHVSRRLYRGGGPWEEYPLLCPPPSLRQRLVARLRCSAERAKSAALGCVPLINAVRTYKPREYLVGDFISGLSTAFLHLPQGLGFGLLASLQPVHGLNTTFFSILIYMIFGSSPHVSMGTNAVIALLTAGMVEKVPFPGGQVDPANMTSANATTSEAELEFKVGVAMAGTFLAGLMLLGMGLLRLGFLTHYMALPFVSGFTNAAACHIATSQITKMLNIQIPRFNGMGKIVRIYIAIFSNIAQTNVADLVIALVSIAILLAVKVGINERFKSRMKIPVPIDLLLVIACTLVSHFGQFQERWGVAVVGTVPSGFPSPRLPEMSVLGQIVEPSFVIAVLTFALTAVLANLCARNHGLQLDNNRELVAYGLTNFLSSFFPCFPSCIAPPRAMILSSLGARTTLNGLPAVVFMVVVLLAAGPLFQALPLAMLGAMIAVAMKDLLLQFRQLPGYWRSSKPDFAIWVVTWAMATLGDLDVGLAAGIGFSIFTVVVAGQLAHGEVLSVSGREDLCLPGKREGLKLSAPPFGILSSSSSSSSSLVAIFYFPSQLYFATAERFRKQLYSKVLDPEKPSGKGAADKNLNPKPAENDVSTPTEEKTESQAGVRYVILDCSAMTYADATGVSVLKLVVAQYAKVDVQVLLVGCRLSLVEILKRFAFFDSFPEDRMFFEVWDALEWLKRDHTTKTKSEADGDTTVEE